MMGQEVLHWAGGDKAVTAWTRLSLPVIDAFSSWTVMRY